MVLIPYPLDHTEYHQWGWFWHQGDGNFAPSNLGFLHKMILLFDMFCAQQMVIFQDSHLFFFQLDVAMTQTIGASAPI